MTTPAEAPLRRGSGRVRRRDPRPSHVAVVLGVVALLNVLLWPTMTEQVNEVVGFTPGQTRDLVERMSTGSGNPIVSDTWTLHLRIGQLVGDEVLRRPPVQPLDPDLLTYLAGVESVVAEPVTVPPETVAAWPRGAAEEAVDEWDVRYLLFDGDTGGQGYRLLRDPTQEHDWLIVPEPWVTGAQ